MVTEGTPIPAVCVHVCMSVCVFACVCLRVCYSGLLLP